MKEKAMAAMLALALVGAGGYLAATSTGAEAHRSDPGGIPDDNPSHHPEDGDGECEKGETVIKTTPSGKEVNVPCNAEHGDDDGDEAGEHDSADDEGDDAGRGAGGHEDAGGSHGGGHEGHEGHGHGGDD